MEDNDSFSSGSSSCFTTERWWPLTPPTTAQRVDCGMVGWKRDFVILVGGSKSLDSVCMYSFPQQKWSDLPHLNIARRHCACAIVKDQYLVVFGGNSNAPGRFVDLDSVEYLDLERPHTGFQLDDTNKLPIPMRNLTAMALHDTVYLFGGYSSRLEGNENLGYLDSILAWSLEGGCRVVAKLPQCRRLPAVFLLQNQQLVIAGGYHPMHKWTNDAYTCPWPPPPNNQDTQVQWQPLPSLPTADSIFAHWTMGNQCHMITNKRYFMLEYGAPKWQHELADHICGTRGLAVPSAIVSYDDDNNWWQLHHATSLGTMTVASVQNELNACELILTHAATAGFWELELLDRAAEAKARKPILSQQLTLLETIEELEQQKQTSIQSFAAAQDDRDFQECRSLAWSIREVERDLEQAYDDLLNVDTDESCHRREVLQRRNSSIQFFRRLNSSAHAPRPTRVRTVEEHDPHQMSVSSIDIYGDNLAPVPQTPQTPSRRKSSMLLKGLLSLRDLKELAKSSDQSTTGGVF